MDRTGPDRIDGASKDVANTTTGSGANSARLKRCCDGARLLRLLRGADAAAPSFFLARWLYLRFLGGVFFVAFVSLWTQVHGLMGSEGILPATEFLERAREQLGRACYWKLPTLCWFSSADGLLSGLCAAGTVLSLLLIAGIGPVPILALLWMTYLSLVVVGQSFLSFQWDVLLLEAGFLSIFIAPWGLRPHPARERPPSQAGRWLLWCLLFKLMFLSGVTKLLSGDPTWRDFSALHVHYETQPLPTWIGWYAHQLPSSIAKTSVVLMYVIEVGVPFLIFAPRRLRHLGCFVLIFFQGLIAATGNYCFFNLLTATLCVLLLDDHLLRRLVPRRWFPWLQTGRRGGAAVPVWRRLPMGVAVTVVLFISGLTLVGEMVRTPQEQSGLPTAVAAVLDGCDRLLLSWGHPYVLAYVAPLRTINGYGLFRVMTTQRHEIVIEGSHDTVRWREYELPWKPGNAGRRPRFVAPHQPRLDWQLWFAALSPRGNAYWLQGLLRRQLEGSPAVLDLFQTNPFPDSPPRYIRLLYYRYRFTDLKTKRATGAWWQRERLGLLTSEPLSLHPQ